MVWAWGMRVDEENKSDGVVEEDEMSTVRL